MKNSNDSEKLKNKFKDGHRISSRRTTVFLLIFGLAFLVLTIVLCVITYPKEMSELPGEDVKRNLNALGGILFIAFMISLVLIRTGLAKMLNIEEGVKNRVSGYTLFPPVSEYWQQESNSKASECLDQ